MKKIPAWAIIFIIIGLIIASKFIFFSNKNTEAGKKSQPGTTALAVNYYVVKSEEFSNNVFATGKIGSINQVEITSEINGKVTGIYFKEGENVSKGSLLVKLSDSELQAQLSKVRTQIKLSEQKLGRISKLLEVNGVSKEEFEMQENELASLRSDEAYIKAQMEKTNIIAPFSGVIGLKNISEGSLVNPNTPIASLVQVKPLYIEFSIPEKYSYIIANGINISFSAENSQQSDTNSAKVYAIEPRVDEMTKTIRARALYNGNKPFFPGTFVKVFVNLGTVKNALMVPTQCVIPTLKGQKVFVSLNGVAAEVPVKIGVRTDKMIQVTEGLNVGDTVITTGLLSVKKDSKLKLLKPAR
jgi:membrane fusion protein, multidrug efflux system